MPTAKANGKTFRFPEGTAPEQMGQAIDEYFSANPPAKSAPDKADSLLKDASDVALEGMAGANRVALQLLDFLGPDQINAVLQLSGSDKRVPTLYESDIGQKGAKGEFMDPGVARDIVRTSSEFAAAGLGSGALLREGAANLPRIASGAESTLQGAIRQLGGSTAARDVATGAVAGAGSEIGGEVGEKVGGATGRQVGELAGSIVAPIGVAGTQQAVRQMGQKAAANRAINKAAPTVDALKDSARALYQQVDDLGAAVSQKPLQTLSNTIAARVKREGFNAKIHPKVSAAMDEIATLTKGDMTISEIDTMRRVARAAARSIDPDESRLGSIMVEQIDGFLDNVPQSALINAPSSKVGPLLKEARGLWGRARRAELIDDAVEKARNQASGFENGLRVQFRSLLNNKKKMQGFSPEEREAIKTVVRGGPAENIARALGKFGFSEGQASSMLLSSLGSAGGFAAGGVVGGVAVPVIGQSAKAAAQRLTRQNVRLASQLIRAGSNGKAIAAAYVRNVPKSEQSVEELTGLLLKGNASLAPLIRSDSKLVSDAAYFASVISSAEVPVEDLGDNELQ